jgi:hypothetical protein
MTRNDIIRMAREAGLTKGQHWNKHNMTTAFMCDFANLVAAAEREECAKLCDAVQQQNENNGAFMWEAKNCATAIRTRGNT